MLLSLFSSLLGEAETVVTIYRRNTDNKTTHTQYPQSGVGLAFPLKGTPTRQQVDAV